MRYHRVIITQDNIAWALNENLRRIEAVLRTKRKVNVSAPMQNIDAQGYDIVGVVSEEDTDLCTLGKFLEIRDE